MKRSLYIAAALISGALIAQYLLADPGYVALRFAGRLVEMSFVTFVLLLIAAWFLVRWLIRLANARSLWREAQLQRKQERARRSLSLALLELSEGNWEAAEDTVLRSARDADAPAAHYLVAARAADLLGIAERRDAHLVRALDV